MPHPRLPERPPRGPAVASMVLAVIGLALFLLPILSLPVSGLAVLAGLVGLVMAVWSGTATLRWAIAGLLLSLVALMLNLSIAYAPEHPIESSGRPTFWRQDLDAPRVPPPQAP